MEWAVPGEVRPPRMNGFTGKFVLARWHKDIGDTVGTWDILATLETDSLVFEMEAFDSGILAEKYFSPGEEVPDGALMVTIVPFRPAP